MEYVEFYGTDGFLNKFKFPHTVEDVAQLIILSGSVSCVVDFVSYSVTAPSMALFFPGQIVSDVRLSDNFKCTGLVLDREFVKILDMPVSFEDRLAFRTNHFFGLSEEKLNAFLNCYSQVGEVMAQKDNPYREKILQHLFSAYYYGLGYYTHTLVERNTAMNRQQEICAKFLSLLPVHSKEHRDIAFYANLLCISEKYLTTLLKAETGHTALEWIEEAVVLYAKSRLLSTSMTVQEISNELDFPSQSVFGKYFKRVVGLSPKAWKAGQDKA
ncbi:MAG: helix-turn-helix domain-containing protein [Candidatus Cryptobacteroides sp.]